MDEKMQIVELTTISLFSNLIFKDVGRHSKRGKEKRSIKVHTVINANEGIPIDLQLTLVVTQDSLMLNPKTLYKGGIIAMNRAYIAY